MPRNNRKYSHSKIYHVMIRGINKKEIFYDDSDRKKFIKILKNTKEKYDYKIYAYCLMNNHVHILIFDFHNKLSKIMQSITIAYALYFNKKYDRVGHLFQNRFKSKCVENDLYLKNLVRYIHQNPEKAGISVTNKYKWSSYKEYVGEIDFVDCEYVLKLYNNNIDLFKEQNLKYIDNYEDDIEYEFLDNIDDFTAIQIIKNKLNIDDIVIITNSNSEIRNQYIKKIKTINGISKRQICRILNISRKMVDRI